MHTQEWKRRQDIESARFRGLAAVSLSPYIEEGKRPAIADALPFFCAPEPIEEDNPQAVEALLECFFVDMKTRAKLRVKTGCS